MHRVPSVLRALDVGSKEQESLSSSVFGLDPKQVRNRIHDFVIERIRATFPKSVDRISVLNFVSSIGAHVPEIEPYVVMYKRIVNEIDFRGDPADVRELILSYPNPDFCFSVVSQLRVRAGYTRMACLELLKYPDKREWVASRLEETVRAHETIVDRFQSVRLLSIVLSHTDFRVYETRTSEELSVMGDYSEFGLCVVASGPRSIEDGLMNELGEVAVVDPVPYSTEYNAVLDRTELIGHHPDYDYVIGVRKKHDTDDYRCAMAFTVGDYDGVVEHLTHRTDRYLMTSVVNELLNRGHTKTADRVLEFISDPLNFDTDTRLRLAYAYRTTPFEGYRAMAVRVLRKSSLNPVERMKLNAVMA